MDKTTILIIPGLGDSGEHHWQSHWLMKFENSVKVIQDNWDEPDLDVWIKTLNDTAERINTPIILVGHSLAVSLIMHWASRHKNAKVVGALLVAPADVDSPTHTPEIVRGFSPMPVTSISFPTIVVASDNDSFVSVDRARFFAEKWGSRFITIGAKGHINSDSNLGYWEEGQNILTTMMRATSH